MFQETAIGDKMSEFDRYFMSLALREAEKAAADGEVPTGCVIVEPQPLEGGPEGHFRLFGLLLFVLRL